MAKDNVKNEKKLKKIHLPTYKIRSIMKSSKDVVCIGGTAPLLVARATEMFLTYLTEASLKASRGNNSLSYKDVADAVNNMSQFEFLKDFIPKKITVRRYKEIMKEIESAEKDADDSIHL